MYLANFWWFTLTNNWSSFTRRFASSWSKIWFHFFGHFSPYINLKIKKEMISLWIWIKLQKFFFVENRFILRKNSFLGTHVSVLLMTIEHSLEVSGLCLIKCSNKTLYKFAKFLYFKNTYTLVIHRYTFFIK